MGIGIKTTAEILRGYRYLIIFFAILELIGVSPYLYIFAKSKRPGQQLPDGTPFYLAGVRSVAPTVTPDLLTSSPTGRFIKPVVTSGISSSSSSTSSPTSSFKRRSGQRVTFNRFFRISEFVLRTTRLGLSSSTFRVINYNTVELSGLTALDFFTGATGTLFVSVIQQKYKLKSKTALLYGAGMTICLELWGAIGSFTHVIGYHHRQSRSLSLSLCLSLSLSLLLSR